MTRIVYLHGFASSPLSTKSQYFRRRFAELGVPFEIPQLDRGDFEGFSVSGAMEVIDEAVRGENVTLMGSSLGGYLAALYASRHSKVERLVLLAPAFQFPTRWRNRFTAKEFEEWKRAGKRNFFHYAYVADRPLGYQFVQDAVQYEDEPDFAQPALILHGARDEMVPVEVSEQFAAHHPNAIFEVVPSDHALTDVLDFLWAKTVVFLGFQKR
jgi:uncharacterized protein